MIRQTDVEIGEMERRRQVAQNGNVQVQQVSSLRASSDLATQWRACSSGRVMYRGSYICCGAWQNINARQDLMGAAASAGRGRPGDRAAQQLGDGLAGAHYEAKSAHHRTIMRRLLSCPSWSFVSHATPHCFQQYQVLIAAPSRSLTY